MSDEWYHHQMDAADDDDEMQEQLMAYKKAYRDLKRKIKYLIYENECFQDSLRKTRRSLLKVSRDRSFLLDQLLQYEKVEVSSSDTEETESSDDGEVVRPEPVKRKKPDSAANSYGQMLQGSGGGHKGQTSAKRRKPISKPNKTSNAPAVQVLGGMGGPSMMADGHMTPEDVKRHLEAKQTYMELLPEKAPPTLVQDMFSNELSLDSESNELCELETSPSNLGDDGLSMDMIPD
ncbi:uncharacterized protein LOC134541091 [Bacillus rossius redtenbacheri]|uniref:uncharacterized protein LOC134541091 n=1 Tax=Bacillus rossius redtenbacheri TaxID=93214 RepID=UPI002FDE33BD